MANKIKSIAPVVIPSGGLDSWTGAARLGRQQAAVVTPACRTRVGVAAPAHTRAPTWSLTGCTERTRRPSILAWRDC